jgi:hypothetical protein
MLVDPYDAAFDMQQNTSHIIPENCKQQMGYILQGTVKNSQAQYSPEIISTRKPRSS